MLTQSLLMYVTFYNQQNSCSRIASLEENVIISVLRAIVMLNAYC